MKKILLVSLVITINNLFASEDFTSSCKDMAGAEAVQKKLKSTLPTPDLQAVLCKNEEKLKPGEFSSPLKKQKNAGLSTDNFCGYQAALNEQDDYILQIQLNELKDKGELLEWVSIHLMDSYGNLQNGVTEEIISRFSKVSVDVAFIVATAKTRKEMYRLMQLPSFYVGNYGSNFLNEAIKQYAQCTTLYAKKPRVQEVVIMLGGCTI